MLHSWRSARVLPLLAGLLMALGSGCHHCETCAACPELPAPDMPRELSKVNHPTYRIEPPDVLLIDAIRLVFREPYQIQPFDQLLIRTEGTLPNEPLEGTFTVDADGRLSLGLYGSVTVAGLSLDQAKAEILNILRKSLKAPRLLLELAQPRGIQQIRGEHLVAQDGTINLGVYGSVPVTGLTVAEARAEIERHLNQFFSQPVVSVRVGGYNSKVYYVIFDGGGFGQQVVRLPITGNETVLDAIGQVNGLLPVSSQEIWIARPAPPELGCDQILKVDWKSITQCGSTETNYQVLGGDRIYVKADPLIKFDNILAKITRPIERLLGVTLLGSATVNSIKNGNGSSSSGF